MHCAICPWMMVIAACGRAGCNWLSANSATPQAQDDRVFTACPECGAELQAALKIYLYGVEVNSAGLLIKYDGGPQPENEDDILELCDLQNTTVYCANDHVFNSDTTVRTKGAQPPDALEVLRRVAAWHVCAGIGMPAALH